VPLSSTEGRLHDSPPLDPARGLGVITNDRNHYIQLRAPHSAPHIRFSSSIAYSLASLSTNTVCHFNECCNPSAADASWAVARLRGAPSLGSYISSASSSSSESKRCLFNGLTVEVSQNITSFSGTYEKSGTLLSRKNLALMSETFVDACRDGLCW
jgi:hypothetical protein